MRDEAREVTSGAMGGEVAAQETPRATSAGLSAGLLQRKIQRRAARREESASSSENAAVAFDAAAPATRGTAEGGGGAGGVEESRGDRTQVLHLEPIEHREGSEVIAGSDGGPAKAGGAGKAGVTKAPEVVAASGAEFSFAKHSTAMPNTCSVTETFGGISSPVFNFSNITVELTPGDKPKISSDLHVEVGWGLNDLGRTNIVRPADAKNADLETVAADLTPNDFGRAPRKEYWSRFISAEHEWFHAREVFAWAQSAEARQVIDDELATRNITDRDSAVSALNYCSVKLLKAWKKYFGIGKATEEEKPGEQRCYKAFKSNYQDLARSLRDAKK